MSAFLLKWKVRLAGEDDYYDERPNAVAKAKVWSNHLALALEHRIIGIGQLWVMLDGI